jgi:hypothetical protein
MSSRALFWLWCALPLAFAARDSALALEGSKVFANGANSLVVETEGRKGTRVYTPDDSEGYDPLAEEEKATATHEPTTEERIDQCMASWDAETHITKSGWRLICQRQIKDNE